MAEFIEGEFSFNVVMKAVSQLDKVTHRLTDWEREFVGNMSELVGLYNAIDAFNGMRITVKQYNTLVTIRDKYL